MRRRQRRTASPPARRLARLQIALGLCWLVDALLQLQPANFSGGVATSILGNAMGQPHWLQHLLVIAAGPASQHPVAANLAIAGAQCTIALGIVVTATRKVALAVSIPWAIGVWVFGEAFGNVASGFAMLPTGAPGSALLYAVAAIVLMPAPTGASSLSVDSSPAAASRHGERRAAATWSALFVVAAVLQAIPVGTLGFKLAANSVMTGIGEPAPLASLDHRIALFGAGHGAEVTAALIVLELAASALPLLGGPTRRRAVAGLLVVLGIVWVLGENVGGLFSGTASDIGAMPLYVILALALLPGRRHAHDGERSPVSSRGRRATSELDATVPSAVRLDPAPAVTV